MKSFSLLLWEQPVLFFLEKYWLTVKDTNELIRTLIRISFLDYMLFDWQLLHCLLPSLTICLAWDAFSKRSRCRLGSDTVFTRDEHGGSHVSPPKLPVPVTAEQIHGTSCPRCSWRSVIYFIQERGNGWVEATLWHIVFLIPDSKLPAKPLQNIRSFGRVEESTAIWLPCTKRYNFGEVWTLEQI